MKISKVLESTVFSPKNKSGNKSQSLDPVYIYPFGDEFLKDWLWGCIREKFRQGIPERNCSDLFRRRNTYADGSEPWAEGREYKLREWYWQILQETLGNQASLDESVIGIDFSSHCLPISLCFFVEVLIPGKPLDWLHLFHPEVVCICAQGSYCLLEG